MSFVACHKFFLFPLPSRTIKSYSLPLNRKKFGLTFAIVFVPDMLYFILTLSSPYLLLILCFAREVFTMRETITIAEGLLVAGAKAIGQLGCQS
jgi:hypothetical protein